MAAPERFAETSDSPLAPRAPSIHGTTRGSLRCSKSSTIESAVDEKCPRRVRLTMTRTEIRT
jgi:hypothetical protein